MVYGANNKTSFASSRREEPSRMKKGNITKFKLSPKKPPKSDWRAFDAMSEEQRHRAALSDPDAPRRPRSSSRARSPRSFCARVAKETEAHPGAVRVTLSSAARHRSRFPSKARTGRTRRPKSC
jgi:hypothetical protein